MAYGWWILHNIYKIGFKTFFLNVFYADYSVIWLWKNFHQMHNKITCKKIFNYVWFENFDYDE